MLISNGFITERKRIDTRPIRWLHGSYHETGASRYDGDMVLITKRGRHDTTATWF